MAGFAVNTITVAGQALLARILSTDQLIYTRVLTSDTALTLSDAQTATLSDFTGPAGDIKAASASGDKARIVGAIGNAASSYTVKSFALCAKAQGDAVDIVLAVQSDPNAAVYIPSAAEPSGFVEIGFLLDISNAESVTVQVVGTGSAALSDLDRLVSCHKAGDPTAGDNQTILGDKTFVGDTTFDADSRLHFGPAQLTMNSAATPPVIDLTGATLYSTGSGYFEGNLTAELDATFWGTCEFATNTPANKVTVDGATGNVSVSKNLSVGVSLSGNMATFIGDVEVASTGSLVTQATSGYFALQNAGQQKFSFAASYNSYRVVINADGITMLDASNNQAFSVDSTNGNLSAAGTASVGGLTGLAPTGGLSALPIGGIVVAFNDDWLAGVQLLAGQRITVAANKLYATSLTGVQPSVSGYLPAGDYILLSNSWTGVQNIPCLVMRVPPEA